MMECVGVNRRWAFHHQSLQSSLKQQQRGGRRLKGRLSYAQYPCPQLWGIEYILMVGVEYNHSCTRMAPQRHTRWWLLAERCGSNKCKLSGEYFFFFSMITPEGQKDQTKQELCISASEKLHRTKSFFPIKCALTRATSLYFSSDGTNRR